MVETIVLIIFFLLISLVLAIVGRAIVTKQSIIGRPPVPSFYFILAKILVLVNLIFLLLRGLNISGDRMFIKVVYIDWFAVSLLIIGTVILFISTIQLNTDLIFGLSSSESHKLQTKGIFSISRHPFYLGFLLILFSSCLLTPHFINIISFIGAWFIHHFIMIKEEEYLTSQYGDEYRQYAQKVNRYLTF
ncbi:MAG: isoprenylcysteine carboxylmethyltransferase family protein [Bacteroidetes bacterium]|nr:isoprenylcysteine carboxylmethyltransferase family protein [Bacteroidota bacterium]